MDTVTAVSDDGSSVGVYTDTDGDGTVDQIIDVHRDGSFTLYLQDDDGAWSVGRTGHIDDAGAVVSDPRVDPAAAGSQPAAFGDQAPDDEGPDDESADGPQITVPGADGTGFSGAATYDATGDEMALGASVRFTGACGRDEFGDELAAALRDDGVDIAGSAASTWRPGSR